MKAINKEISKAIQKDITQYKNKQLLRTIEENKGVKIMRKKITNGKKEIFPLENVNGSTVTDRDKLVQIVKEFYTALYKSQIDQTREEPVQKIQNQEPEEITDDRM
ncbi:hypothetical protein HHI36_017513, partial [Cryptolaemus montrouzieri]